jgi:hypothetical protein
MTGTMSQNSAAAAERNYSISMNIEFPCDTF